MQAAIPQPHMDLYTVKVMTMLTISVTSLATMLASRVNRRSEGMRLFALGLVLLAGGTGISILRSIISGPFIILAGNVVMLAGIITATMGVRVFREFTPWSHPILAAFCTVVAIPYCYWLFIDNKFGLRVGVMSAAFSFLFTDAALSMFRRVPYRARLTYWPTGCAFAFAALYLAMRAVAGWSGAYGDALLSSVPRVEFVSTICADIVYVACTVGMILASNTQLWQQAERLAHMDALTNLPNRRWFLDRLLAAEARALAGGGKLGIIYLDLDGFKAVNDRLGHATGDALLQKVSEAMTRVIRGDDCAARLGGDEFVVLAEQVESRAQLGTLAERLKGAIESEPVPGTEDEPVRVSLGIAVFPDDGTSAHDAMREADAAMYLTKRQTRWAQSSR